ncbi:MAG: HINT domain-containing protein [Azoarcus sp.]|nr:HINT domain-containing protein [Azoarcus sp.]
MSHTLHSLARTTPKTRSPHDRVVPDYAGDWVLPFPDDQVPPLRVREENGERWFIPRQEHEYTYRQVTRTFVQENKPVCEVKVHSNGLDDIDFMKVTLDHPFYVFRKGWTPASELRFGDRFFGPEYEHLLFGKVEFNEERSTVYNLEVDEFHTYYVGKFGVWVHNTCGDFAMSPSVCV